MIGGGFYGATVAAHLAARTGRVSLIEAGPHLLGRASFANQARVHAGYHYPRSILTALRSSVNFKRFCATYAEAVDSDFVSLYAIARESKVTASQFATVCEAIGAPVQPADATLRRWFATDLVEEVFVTRECAFNAERLRGRAESDLARAGVDCRTGVSALAVEPTAGDRVLVVDSEGHRWNAGTVFACVYAQTNTLLHRSGLPRLPGSRDRTAEYLRRIIQVAAGLGAGAMVFGSPKNRQRGNTPPQEAARIATDFFADLGGYAAEHDVVLCLEANAPGYDCDFVCRTEEAVDLVQRVSSPGFRVQIDTSTMAMNNEDYRESIGLAAPVAGHLHISEPHLGPVGPDGQVPVGTVLEAVDASNYDGWVSIEMRPTDDGRNLDAVHRALNCVTRVGEGG